jgi:hypothetical protein
LARDILNGIEFIGLIAFGLLDGEYDDDYGPHVQAIVGGQSEDGKCQVQTVKGFKHEGKGERE